MKRQKTRPNRFLRFIISQLAIENERSQILGDFDEEYGLLVRKKGKLYAIRWYVTQILISIYPFLKAAAEGNMIMFKNYVKIASRNIRRKKVYSFINIAGLALGMACCILILLWIWDELSYDRFHKNAENIYAVGSRMQTENKAEYYFATPSAVGPALKDEYPEIVNSARIYGGTRESVLSYEDKKFSEIVVPADPALLEMFSFSLILGDEKTALSEPHSIVMTEDMAVKYFGKENPLGKIIKMDSRFSFTVTGVMKNIPKNSTIQFDFFVPLEFIKELYGAFYLSMWRNYAYRTYIQIKEGIPYESINDKIAGRIWKEIPDDNTMLFLRPLTGLRLYRMGQGDGSIETVRIFGTAAFLILLIACFNFINLSIAGSVSRSKEIGMRKTFGAYRKDIVKQFYGESVVLLGLALMTAVILVKLFLPVFNNLTGKSLGFNIFGDTGIFRIIVGVTVLTGLVCGSYPALYLSAFKPVKAIRGEIVSGSRSPVFRKILVIFQFSLSTGLIICTMVISGQMDYVLNSDLGYEKDNIVYLNMKENFRRNYFTAKNELLQNPDILSVTSMNKKLIGGGYWCDYGWNWEGKSPDTDPLIYNISVDSDFFKTFGTELIEGEFLDANKDTQPGQASRDIIITQSFADILGSGSPVGRRVIDTDGKELTVKGVIKDFHMRPLYDKIVPVAIYQMHGRQSYLYAKIRQGRLKSALASLEKTWNKFTPESPFEYGFLDESHRNVYRTEERTKEVFLFFSVLAVFISCLGLFGLSSLIIEQRTREIGIRKVLGAPTAGIIGLLSGEFMRWVILANVIAWPAAWYYSREWLNNFSYRITPGIGIFFLAGISALFTAVITVIFRSVKAARANPVDTIRYE